MRLPTYQQLSKEQDRVLNLPLNGSYIVAGPPGTGKTVVALYRADTLSENGGNPLLIMYNRLLMQYTDAATDELDIDGITKTFHQWFGRFYLKHYGAYAPQVAPYVFNWEEILKVLNRRPPRQDSLPYMLLDEAQDFPKEFFPVARLVTRNLTIFADENQRIWADNSTLKDIKLYSGIGDEGVRWLEKNYRNTREIAELAAEFVADAATGVAELPDRRGDRPRVLRFPSKQDSVNFIARFARNNPDQEIGVLLPTQRLQRLYAARLEGMTGGRIEVYIGGKGKKAVVFDFDQPGIKIVNYKSSKGLEFDTVFLPELQKFGDIGQPDKQMLLFVLIARARDQLFLSHTGGTVPSVITALPKDKVEFE